MRCNLNILLISWHSIKYWEFIILVLCNDKLVISTETFLLLQQQVLSIKQRNTLFWPCQVVLTHSVVVMSYVLLIAFSLSCRSLPAWSTVQSLLRAIKIIYTVFPYNVFQAQLIRRSVHPKTYIWVLGRCCRVQKLDILLYLQWFYWGVLSSWVPLSACLL